MKTTLIAIAGLATAASAQTVIDLSGINVDGAAPTSFSVNVASGGALASLDFDITVDNGGVGGNLSWASEVFIGLTHDASGYTFTADGNDIDLSDDGPNDLLFGWGNSGGVFSFAGNAAAGPLADASGTWTVTLIDQFDDFGVDHTYLQGSTITINQVPAPAGLAILGLGGLVAARRRR